MFYDCCMTWIFHLRVVILSSIVGVGTGSSLSITDKQGWVSCHRRLIAWSFFRQFASAGSPPDLDVVQLGTSQASRISLVFFYHKRTQSNYAGTLFVVAVLPRPKRHDMQRLPNPTSARVQFLRLLFFLQRTEIPDLCVNILEAMFMDASSWKSNFAAYGI